MKRSLLLLFLLAACQSGPTPGPPQGPDDVPACLENDQRLYELAQPIELGQAVSATTGDRWFKVIFDAPTDAAISIENIPEYGVFGYSVRPASNVSGTGVIAGDSFLDSRDGQIKSVSDTFFVYKPGIYLVNVDHLKVEDRTCATYRLTVSKR